MTYKHLSQKEQYQMYILMSAGNSQQQIAELLGRHKSTISREIARNTGGRGYRPRQACLLAQEWQLKPYSFKKDCYFKNQSAILNLP